jgi:hypothetical protein
MLLPLLLATVALGGIPASSALAPKTVAGRCGYPLGIIMRPPGVVDMYVYPAPNGQPQRGTKLATANAGGGVLSSSCDRVKALTPPLHPRGLAGPWPRSAESNIYCPEGGTVQIRPIVTRGRLVGTRLLVMRKDVVGHDIHVLDGGHVIVNDVLRKKSGGISFDPNYCDRTSIK